MRPHALCELTRETGEVVTEYRYLQVQGIQKAQDDASVIIVYLNGRARVWSLSAATGGAGGSGAERDELIVQMKKQASLIGVSLKDGPPTSVSAVQVERAKYGAGSGVPLSTFLVTKITARRKGRTVSRKLSITDEYLVERDAASFQVISARPLKSIFALVRPWDEPRIFKVEYDDMASRTYSSNDRDMALGSILDAAQSCGNQRCYVSAEVSDGLRLTPRHAVEVMPNRGKASTFFREAFFGPETIEGWHLKQLTKATTDMVKAEGGGALASPGGTVLADAVQCAQEFNANIPVTGVDPQTDKDKITKASGALLTVLNALAAACERAPDVGVLRDLSAASATLLQALLRLTLTAHAQKYVPKIPDVTAIFLRLLRSREPFVAYWTVMVLSAVLRCPLPDGKRNTKQEYENKQLLLASAEMNSALVALLSDHKVAMLIKKSRTGAFTKEQAAGSAQSAQSDDLKGGSDDAKEVAAEAKGAIAARGASSALSIMAVSGLLESVLCSSRDTTAPERFDTLLNVLAREYQSLMSMLRSPCSLIMENATLLMQTIHEQAPQLAADLREVAMSEMVILRHFHLSIFSPSPDQRFVSRHLTKLWMTGSPGSAQKVLLMKMLPAGLLEYLKMPELTPAEMDNLDFIETMESEFAAHTTTRESGGDGSGGPKRSMQRLRERIAAAAGGAGGAGGGGAPAPVAPAAAAVPSATGGSGAVGGLGPVGENFRVMFHTITQDHKLPDLIWNQTTRRELRSALEEELRGFDAAVRDAGHGNVAWNHQQFRVVSIWGELVMGECV